MTPRSVGSYRASYELRSHHFDHMCLERGRCVAYQHPSSEHRLFGSPNGYMYGHFLDGRGVKEKKHGGGVPFSLMKKKKKKNV